MNATWSQLQPSCVIDSIVLALIMINFLSIQPFQWFIILNLREMESIRYFLSRNTYTLYFQILDYLIIKCIQIQQCKHERKEKRIHLHIFIFLFFGVFFLVTDAFLTCYFGTFLHSVKCTLKEFRCRSTKWTHCSYYCWLHENEGLGESQIALWLLWDNSTLFQWETPGEGALKSK